MSYASGGLIQATDYNALVGSNSTTAGTLNYVWSTGNGQYGYGQTAVGAVSGGSVVTATQWTTMLNALNGALGHQSGSAAQLPPAALNYTSGQVITYFANVNTSITSTIQTNHNSYTAQGSTTTGSNYSYNPTATAGTTYTAYIGSRTVTFASGDAARYFFNAGGALKFVTGTVTNGDGTARSTDAVSLLSLGTYTFGQAQYNAVTTSYVNAVATSDSGTYTGNYGHLDVLSSAQNASGNGDKGAAITFGIYLYEAHAGAFNNTLNVTMNHRIDIVYPETTYLTSSPWGTPTVS